MTVRPTLVCCCAFLLFAVVISPRSAAAQGVLRACVQKSSQQVRIIGDGESCRAVETLVIWNVAGASGPEGPAGPAGPQGPPGPPASATTPAIWSGGCSHNSPNSVGPNSFSPYCTDIQDFNTAASHLVVDPSGLFSVQAQGFYRVSFQTLINSCANNAANVKLLQNGQSFHWGFGGTGFGNVSVQIIWPFNAGDTFDVQTSGCSNAFSNLYSYRAWSAGPHGSRLQIEYVGPLN